MQNEKKKRRLNCTIQSCQEGCLVLKGIVVNGGIFLFFLFLLCVLKKIFDQPLLVPSGEVWKNLKRQ